jgi:NAD(P)H dehydrogenase (quinone)
VLDELLAKTDAGNVVALARDPSALADYAAKGVQVRQADYDDPASLDAALAGIDRVLLISGNAVGQRERQHGAVIEAAKKAGVSYLAYTSVLNAQGSKLLLAAEHVLTEKLLEKSGLNYDVLRMPWYSENYTGALAPAIEHGAIFGATGEGRLSTATRADLAGGAVGALLNSPGGKVYEFAGDQSWSMAEVRGGSGPPGGQAGAVRQPVRSRLRKDARGRRAAATGRRVPGQHQLPRRVRRALQREQGPEHALGPCDHADRRNDRRGAEGVNSNLPGLARGGGPPAKRVVEG